MFKIGIFDKKIGIMTDCRLVAFTRVLVPYMPIEDPYKSKFFFFFFFHFYHWKYPQKMLPVACIVTFV